MPVHGPGPRPGWRPTPTTTTAAVPPSFPLDDGEDWWAGNQFGFVSVPIAGALAALSLSVAITASFNAPADEFPFPNTSNGHETYQVLAVGEEPRFTAFTADDDFVPRAFDEGEWLPQQPQPPPVQRLVSTDDDWVAAPAIAEEDYWTPPVTDPVIVTIVNWPVTGAGGFPAESFAPEEGEWSFALKAVPPLISQWTGEDETVPQPVFRPDEDYWSQFVTDPVDLTVVNWPVTGAGGPPDPVPIVDELYWLVLPVQPRTVVFGVFSSDDEIVPAAFGASSGAAAYPPPSQRARHTPQIKLWETGDEVVTPAVPLNVEDEYWQYFPPQVVLPKVTLWQVEDEWEIPPPPLLVDETNWDFAQTNLVTPQPLYLPDPEDLQQLFIPIPPVVTPAPVGGGWFYKPIKKKKKKEQIAELENVAVIEAQDLTPAVYRYIGDLGPELTNIRIQMVAHQGAMAYAKAQNERIAKEKRLDRNDGEFMVIIAMMDEDDKRLKRELDWMLEKIKSLL